MQKVTESEILNLVTTILGILIKNPTDAVGIATRYGLDSPEIESRWGVRFSAPVSTGSGAHPASYSMGTGSLSRGESGRNVALTTHTT
jgi:hypothetical protein